MSLIEHHTALLWAANNVNYNPLNLPPYTIRCKFSPGYTPTMGDSQTLVDAVDNVWDIYKNSTNWATLFTNNTDLLEILGANATGVTDIGSTTTGRGMCRGATSLTSVGTCDFSSATVLAQLFSGCTSLAFVGRLNTASATSSLSMFQDCTALTVAPTMDLSHVTNTQSMYAGATALSSVPRYSLSAVTQSGAMFKDCISLTTVPLFDLSSLQVASSNRGGMFQGCTSLTAVPLFSLPSITSMGAMFRDCTAVESGALALYQSVSTQANPPSSHANCFTNCGSNTVTGAAELAQIPSSWGGTGA